MAVNTIVPKKLATNSVAKEYSLDENVGFLLIRVTGLNDVYIYFDSNPKSDAFLVPRDVLMPIIKVNNNVLRYFSVMNSELSILTWG